MIKIVKSEVYPNMFLLRFNTPQTMAKTLLRFEEHYESIEFKDKIFTLKEFKKWYSKAFGHGKFTYYGDWNGFNFPSYALDNFYKGEFDPLLQREKQILDMFSDLHKKDEKFYIIAIHNYCDLRYNNALLHEMAHALWYLEPEYKKSMEACLDNIPTDFVSQINEVLASYEYHPAVWRDETHAFLLEEKGRSILSHKKDFPTLFRNERFYKQLSELEPFINDMVETFNTYAQNNNKLFDKSVVALAVPFKE